MLGQFVFGHPFYVDIGQRSVIHEGAHADVGYREGYVNLGESATIETIITQAGGEIGNGV